MYKIVQSFKTYQLPPHFEILSRKRFLYHERETEDDPLSQVPHLRCEIRRDLFLIPVAYNQHPVNMYCPLNPVQIMIEHFQQHHACESIYPNIF